MCWVCRYIKPVLPCKAANKLSPNECNTTTCCVLDLKDRYVYALYAAVMLQADNMHTMIYCTVWYDCIALCVTAVLHC